MIKVGLYSITYLGIWYDGPALTFSELVQRAKAYGYAGIELDGKRPHGNPMDLDQRTRDEMRNILEREGVEMVCVAANNDFSSPVAEHRECQLLMVRELARLATGSSGFSQIFTQSGKIGSPRWSRRAGPVPGHGLAMS